MHTTVDDANNTTRETGNKAVFFPLFSEALVSVEADFRFCLPTSETKN